jgi:Cu/Ag efflux protein CusF
MNRLIVSIAAVALGTMSLTATHHLARAQPAKGAPAAFERVREVMSSRFKDMKLTGDPDRDFAALLIAHHEDLIFLAKTQLEYGGDRQMRQMAQRILDEKQKEIDELKQWQVRMRQPDYRAQPDQPPPGSGPLDQKPPAPAAQVQTAPAQPPAQEQPVPAAQRAAQNLPLVSGTVEKVDAAAGKITIEHGAIPNLNMDSMTMVFRAQDPAMLKGIKQRDKIRFTADRVNGQITVTKIQKGR